MTLMRRISEASDVTSTAGTAGGRGGGRACHKMQMQRRVCFLQIKCQDIKNCQFHFAARRMTNPYSPLNKALIAAQRNHGRTKRRD